MRVTLLGGAIGVIDVDDDSIDEVERLGVVIFYILEVRIRITKIRLRVN